MAGEITVVGGGLAGLVAAITSAEAGASVTLHEAHSSLGGRGRATAAPYVAHEGPHVFYADGPHWTWLRSRGLVPKLGLPGPSAVRRFGFRSGGELSRKLPGGFVRMVTHRNRPAPVDRDFHSWASERYGERAAVAAANTISVVTYDADTGRLSADFVWRLLHRVFAPKLPAVRWAIGGWQAVLGQLENRANELGVRIERDSRITELPSGGPTIVATELSSARQLLGDDSLRWESGYCVLLDIAVRRSRSDSFAMFDMDEGGFHECYSAQDPTIAPAGQALFQLDMPVRTGESTSAAHTRLESFADVTVPGWRERLTWRQTATARGRTGALDLPGRTWRDRPAVSRGGGVFLAGDMVAAPGMRGEISINSAVLAARGALSEIGLTVPARRSP